MQQIYKYLFRFFIYPQINATSKIDSMEIVPTFQKFLLSFSPMEGYLF